MTFPELRDRCRRRSDYILTAIVINELSLFLTWIFCKTSITPNQVTLLSLACGLLSGIFYAFGFFCSGSFFLFIAHTLDCTDGNLARAKQQFSQLGKWLDMVVDRFSQTFVFLGVAFYFLSAGAHALWLFLSLCDAVLLTVYYYSVDIALAYGLSKPVQTFSQLTLKGVHIKWGLLEPVIYGFVILAPIGLLKLHIVLVLISVSAGLIIQCVKMTMLLGKR